MFRNIYSFSRQVVRTLLLSLKQKAADSPKLKRIALTLLKPFPKLTARLKSVGQVGIYSTLKQTPQELRGLSPRGKQIYAQLKQAIENQNNKS